MVSLPARSVIPALLLVLAAGSWPADARAESLTCLVSRGNLCFSTGCDNGGRSQRLSLDLAAGTYRLCPNRYNDQGCTEAPMQFEIHDSAIVGISQSGAEIAARAVFVNRVTGALSMSLLAAGLSGIDYGNCQIPR